VSAYFRIARPFSPEYGAPAYLKKLGDNALLNQCTLIYNIAEAMDTAEITPYGVLPETVVSLKKEIDDFAALVAKPRTEIITRSRATSSLEDLFKETNELLRNQLDKLMLVLRLGNPVFYNEYKSARIIVDLHGSRKETVETEVEEA
jgi:hypothetical protein